MSVFNFFSRRAGFNALSSLDDCRLSDLGLNRYDLHAARSKGASAASYLNDRRSERASSWLR